jgi:UDP:flavonoid glycosyltransferase YjiC (YdhE family)
LRPQLGPLDVGELETVSDLLVVARDDQLRVVGPDRLLSWRFSMSAVLFVTWDGGGNFPPALGIALELQRRGDEPRFLGHPRQRTAVESAGLPFESFTRGRAWDSSRPINTVQGLIGLTGVFTDRGIGEDAVTSAIQERTDIVVVDCMLFAALRAVAAAGLPTVSLVHTFQHYLDRSIGRGLIAVTSAVRGIRPTTSWASADLRLICALPELDGVDGPSLPARTLHIGPVWQGHPAPAKPGPDRPRVLVSFSTCWYPGQSRTLQTVLDALATLPLDAVVTTGPAMDPAELRSAPNIRLLQYVDHARLMPGMSLVIGHGGHSTAMRALSYDLPVLTLPMHPLLDQAMVGQAIADAGAGRIMRRSSTASEIATVITELTAVGPHRQAARRLGAAIRQRDGAVAGADQISALAQSG